jgi:protease-4
MAKQDSSSETPSGAPGWERDLVTRLASAALKEQRRARRWSVFFKLLLFAYLIALIVPLYWEDGELKLGKEEKHTALVEIKGVVADGKEANAEDIIEGLRDAFDDKDTKGVILRINSPGGSPVQAGYVYDEIRRLREEHPDIPLYAVVVDMAASGGYYIATAADKIYVNKASLVGSVGVRLDSFGLVGAIDKLGVQRRLYTAGDHKGMLDPFLPEDATEVEHINQLLENIYIQFTTAVKEGRGDRLKDDPRIFSGLVWSGEQAVAMGMADDFGSASYVAREVVKAEELEDFTPPTDYLERLAKRIGASASESLAGWLTGTEWR